MNARIILWSLTSALAGFLFGFDTVVISGAEQKIQAVWQLGDGIHGLAMSMALWGTVLGALTASWPTDRWGRKKTLLAIGVLYFVSAVGSALAPEVISFMVARFVGGVGVGISTVAAPLYISEIAPPRHRGRLTGLFQFNIVLGILIAYLSNALLVGTGEHAWRFMLGVEAIPALIYAFLCFGIPESPRWLLRRRENREEGLRVLALVEPDRTPAQLEVLAHTIEVASQPTRGQSRFWTAGMLTPISLAFLVAFFNQLSGINAILYFSPRIFALTGLDQSAALLQSIGIGITNLIFTFVGLWLIDRLGRRTLLYIGSVGYIVSLGMCAWAFATEVYAIVAVCIFAFIAAHAIGQGAVIWVFISEIFPNRHRARGQSLGCTTHWVFAALVTMVFPVMVGFFSAAQIFGFFCFMMVLQLIWVRVMVPETKGRPLEQLGRELSKA